MLHCSATSRFNRFAIGFGFWVDPLRGRFTVRGSRCEVGVCEERKGSSLCLTHLGGADYADFFIRRLRRLRRFFFGFFGGDKEMAEWDGIVCYSGSLNFNKHNPSVEICAICG